MGRLTQALTKDPRADSQSRDAPGLRALVTGLAGQDGWYLAQNLLRLGYDVVGTTHRREAPASVMVENHPVTVLHLDLTNSDQVDEVIGTYQFDEVYNLAGRASSDQLFDDPIETLEVNGMAVARLLEAVARHSSGTRLCQASSSEVFAGSDSRLQDEATVRRPLNAYGVAKALADDLVYAYRTTKHLFACSAILFSHESPRRSAHFLVRKVCRAAALIAASLERTVTVNSLTDGRDWGYAPDYVEAMRLMLQQSEPRDYVVATGEARTVQEVCEVAFDHVGLDWREHVHVSSGHHPASTSSMRAGDARRARSNLDWAPSRTFVELIQELVDEERLHIAEGNAEADGKTSTN